VEKLGLGKTNAKMGADSSEENTDYTPKFIRTICPIGPKVWNIVEKRFHCASVVPASVGKLRFIPCF
jgi:hypothetical protein